MATNGVPVFDECFGSMAIATNVSRGLSYRTDWAHLSWGDVLLDFWDDFSKDGKLEERPKPDNENAPMASLCAPLTIPANGSASVTFMIAWHFPNRQSWTDIEGTPDLTKEKGPRWVGNYYSTQFTDAWDVVRNVAPKLPQLEADSLKFVNAFLSSDLPDSVKEAALFNLSTLRTQTCFRIASGKFFGWEGCADTCGSCLGNCTHVWNYETATHYLFGSLARDMRDTEFNHAVSAAGWIPFRINLPLEGHALDSPVAAADGQMGTIMRFYLDWTLSGNDEMLRSLWPKVRLALEFCWVENGWDGDQDGVMEGCQHNTMDVEYYGPNPQMQFCYLGALRACEEMARYLGENDFAVHCHNLFKMGSEKICKKMFNGDYYEHIIEPRKSEDAIAPCIKLSEESAVNPVLQIGAGCLIDQLVGQYMAHICGLGYLDDPKRISTATGAVMRNNFRKDLYGHFNHLRSFALNDESALLMASYPRGRRPKRPFPYCNEVMTGFEYTAATQMIFENQVADGLKVVSSIRTRYNGKRRNPFDEAECGHHYARAMASWSSFWLWRASNTMQSPPPWNLLPA